MAIRVTTTCPVCGGMVVWNVWEENYGADADGNRGMLQTDGEVVEPCPNDCEWTGDEEENQFAEAVEQWRAAYYADAEEEAEASVEETR